MRSQVGLALLFTALTSSTFSPAYAAEAEPLLATVKDFLEHGTKLFVDEGTVKDSGVSTNRDDHPTWLDNERVLFKWKTERDELSRVLRAEAVLWDTVQGKIAPAPTNLVERGQFCLHGQFVSYFRKSLDADSGRALVYGRFVNDHIVDEHVQELSKQHYEPNPFSCRYYAAPYPWTVNGWFTTPLLEEHGSLGWEKPKINDPFGRRREDEEPITLFRPGDQNGTPLPISRAQGVSSRPSYAPFRTAYLLFNPAPSTGITARNEWPQGKAMPIWWLTPNGTVTEQLLAYHPFMTTASYLTFLPLKEGVFIYAQDIGLGHSLRNSGGYIAKNGTTRKLIGGLLHNPVVSPDGCRVAFVHEPSFPTDREHMYTVKLKVIDVCEAAQH